MTDISGFGSRVIGEKQFEEEQSAVATSSHIYGYRVVERADPTDQPETKEAEPFLEGEPRPKEPPPSPIQTPTFLEALGTNTEGKLERVKSIRVIDQLEEDEKAGQNRAEVLEALEVRRQNIQKEGALSIDQLREALGGAPEFLDEAITREFNRPQIRKGALRLFIEIETNREGGPRAPVLTQLEKALG
jgi:hypothetical protein